MAETVKSSKNLAEALLAAQSRFHGHVSVPGMQAYERARIMPNPQYTGHPAAIVGCASVDDVVRCLELADRHETAVVARSGGHHLAGFSAANGALMIDLSPLRKMNLNEDRRTAEVGAGLLNRDLYWWLDPYGLAAACGTVAGVGVAGYSLHGGFGYGTPLWGLGCDNFTAAEVVLADGTVRTVSAESDPELMFGLRGAGSNFGIATGFEIRVHPFERGFGGTLIYPAKKLRDVVLTIDSLARRVPHLYLDFHVMAPDMHCDGERVLFVTVLHPGSETEAAKDIEPLLTLRPLRNFLRMRRFTEMMRQYGELDLHPDSIYNLDTADDDTYYYWDGRYIAGAVSDALIETLEAIVADAPPGSHFMAYGMQGEATLANLDETCFRLRAPGWFLQMEGFWPITTDGKDANVAWVKRSAEVLGEHGKDVHYLGSSSRRDSERVRRFYGDAWPRLQKLKQRVDPTNRFHSNVNIPPA